MSRTGLGRALAAIVLALTLGVANAAAASITFDFNISPSGSGSTGNQRVYSEDGVTVYAMAWYLTSSGADFQKAALGQYSGSDGGLGVCNAGESCEPNQHAVDNVSQYDFILFLFDQSVDPTSVRLNEYGDTDVSYWLGNVAGLATQANLLLNTNTSELGAKGFGSRQNENNGSENDRTVTLSSPLNAYNALLIGTTMSSDYDGNDRFKLKNLTIDFRTPEIPETPVPEPGTIALLGLGLAGLAVARRRQAKRS